MHLELDINGDQFCKQSQRELRPEQHPVSETKNIGNTFIATNRASCLHIYYSDDRRPSH